MNGKANMKRKQLVGGWMGRGQAGRFGVLCTSYCSQESVVLKFSKCSLFSINTLIFILSSLKKCGN
jgi:hypothetical protein